MNKLKFSGILCTVDEPSDLPPFGSSGHRVKLNKSHAKKVLKSLEGQGVCVSDGLTTHNPKKKIGIITKVKLKKNKVYVEGHLWDKNFPNEIKEIKAITPSLGMSYEAEASTVVDMSAEIWEVEPEYFSGAAICLRDKVAYKISEFKIE